MILAAFRTWSVDGKKRELIGNFKNGGRTWRRKAREVKDHDFPSDAQGVALAYGIYDVRHNTGMLVVGTSRETPEFAVDAIEHWWRRYGKKHYRGATELLILADSGGANSPRCKLWKCDLQQKLCNEHGLRVTLCHYPPGASKWNPIEHRLFSEISKNWQGVPLETYEVALNYISTTRTRTGLRVSAKLNSKIYEKGQKVADEEMKLLKIRTHRTLPEDLQAEVLFPFIAFESELQSFPIGNERQYWNEEALKAKDRRLDEIVAGARPEMRQ